MKVSLSSKRVNNLLRSVCAVLLVLCAVDAIYKIASIPLFYQRAVSGTLPDLQLKGFIQPSNASTAQEAALRGMTIPGYGIYRIARDGLYTLVFYIVAFLILRRARGQWFLWFTALVMFFVPAGQLNFYTPLDQNFSRYLALLGLLWPAFPLFLYLFPNGRAVPGWLRWLIGPVLVVHLILQGIAALTLMTGRPNNLIAAITPYLSFILLSFPLALFGQVYRYLRVSTREERLQTKWVLGGLVGVVLGGVIIAVLFNQVDVQADYGFSSDVTTMLTLLIPITIGISILRYRLYDIDVIIRRTLVYSLLSAMLGLLYFGSVTVLQSLFTSLGGSQSTLALVLSTLAIAALFTPLRRRLQITIDRRFYRQKYDTVRAMEGFNTVVRSEVELDVISQRLAVVAHEALQPEHISLWLKKQEIHR
jgi:hypothetical protein